MNRIELLIVFLSLTFFFACEPMRVSRAEKEVVSEIISYEQKVMPLSRCIENVRWQVAQGERGFASDRLEGLRLERAILLSDKEKFEKISKLYKDGYVRDAYLSKQLRKIYFSYTVNQADSILLVKESQLEAFLKKTIYTYEVVVKGEAMSLCEFEHKYNSSMNTILLKEKWYAELGLAKVLKDSIITLVKCRNAMAKQIGYKDYYHYRMASNGQEMDSIDAWFNILDLITREPYRQIKQKIDVNLAKQYRCNISDLRPWHYKNPFFKEVHNVYDVGQTKSYVHRDMVQMANWFYTGLGFDLSYIYSESDLEYRKGKHPLNFCCDIDKNGDIRIMCNLRSDMNSMNEILKQSAYALYRKEVSKSLPLLLRDISDPILYEGIAMMFRRLPSNGTWLQSMGLTRISMGEHIDRESYLNLRAQEIIFSRWSQVLYRFERALYENPEQDLDEVWWNLIAEYQLLPIPQNKEIKGGWASKIHLVFTPCYYHNYLLGNVVASELNQYICDSIIHDENYWAPDYVNREEIGRFLRENIFWHGDVLTWQEILQESIHKTFSFESYKCQFVDMSKYDSLQQRNQADKEKIRLKYLENKF